MDNLRLLYGYGAAAMYRSTIAPTLSINAVIPTTAMPLDHLPVDARPREKLLQRGPAALSDSELLAILLRTGIPGKDVLQLADELLRTPHRGAENGAQAQGFGGIAGLLQTDPKALARSRGWGRPNALKYWRCWNWRDAPWRSACKSARCWTRRKRSGSFFSCIYPLCPMKSLR